MSLKHYGELFLAILVVIFGFLMSLMPIAGYILLGVLGSALLVLVLFQAGVIYAFDPVVYQILGWSWKIYFAGFFFVLFVMITATYQHCCVGINSFRDHMKHGKERNKDAFTMSLLWPLKLYFIDAYMKGWGLSWADVAINAFEYWLVTTWKGVRLETWNVQTGEKSEERVKKE